MKPIHRAAVALKHNGHGRNAIIEEVKSRFSNLANEAKVVEGEMYDAAVKRGGELLETAQKKGQKALTGTERWVKKNPGAAIGAAFVFGILLKSWFTRRED